MSQALHQAWPGSIWLPLQCLFKSWLRLSMGVTRAAHKHCKESVPPMAWSTQESHLSTRLACQVHSFWHDSHGCVKRERLAIAVWAVSVQERF